MKILWFVSILVMSALPSMASTSELGPHVKDCFITPCELTADFDGNKKSDSARLVKNKDGKKGIMVRFDDGRELPIGAGQRVGNGGDDFHWLDRWRLHKGEITAGSGESSPVKPKGDSLFVEKTDSASAIIYWDGTRFQWKQQGD